MGQYLTICELIYVSIYAHVYLYVAYIKSYLIVYDFVSDQIWYNILAHMKKKYGHCSATRREFLMEILYKNIAIIAKQHSKMYFVDTFGDFSHTVDWNSFKSVWQISLYILA